MAEANRQLDALGLVVKRGTLVDATMIAGVGQASPYEGGGVNPRDPDARFTCKRKTYFGYKAHLAVDEESGLVRQAEMTPANVHDCRLGEALIQGDEQGYFADKAYDSQALRETLERRGLVDGMAWKGRRNTARALAEADQRLGGEHPLRRRARQRHDEALVRPEPRALSGPRPQRLPSPVRRHRDEHEARPRPDGKSLIRSRAALPAPPPDRNPARSGRRPPPKTGKSTIVLTRPAFGPKVAAKPLNPTEIPQF